MAQREFRPARALLPRVLTRLSRETGRAGALRPLWEEAVGAIAARASRPLFLEGTTLVVEVETPRWAAALASQEAELLARLAQRLGEGAVRTVMYRSKTNR